MVSKHDQEEPEESVEEEASVAPGRKRYGRLVRMFREGYLAVHIFKNVHEHRTFYDIVILRKIRREAQQEYTRYANLKPYDLPSLMVLLKAAEEFLKSVDGA